MNQDLAKDSRLPSGKTEADGGSHRLLDGMVPSKTIERQDDGRFCGQASFGHPEQVERSNDSLTKAYRDTVVALWPWPF